MSEPEPRRPHDDAGTVMTGVLVLCVVGAVVFAVAANAPALCGAALLMLVWGCVAHRAGQPEPDSSSGDDEDDGGGGSGPGAPPRPPADPRGGVPLPDADQARRRLRDHDRERFGSGSLSPRRHPRTPRRTPTRVP